MAKRERTQRPAAPSYGVFVQFRNRRLTLRRGLPTAEDASAFLREVRALRFHNPENVFIVREPEGTLVDEVPAPISVAQAAEIDGHANGHAEGAPRSMDGAPPSPEPALVPPPSIPASGDGAVRYAKAVAAAIKVLGPMSREHVLGMFQGLGLSPGDAESVLVYALLHAILFLDAEDPALIRMEPADLGPPVPRAPRRDARKRARVTLGNGATAEARALLGATLELTRVRVATFSEALLSFDATRARTARLIAR